MFLADDAKEIKIQTKEKTLFESISSETLFQYNIYKVIKFGKMSIWMHTNNGPDTGTGINDINFETTVLKNHSQIFGLMVVSSSFGCMNE